MCARALPEYKMCDNWTVGGRAILFRRTTELVPPSAPGCASSAEGSFPDLFNTTKLVMFQGGTLLTSDEVNFYAAQCGAPIIALSR